MSYFSAARARSPFMFLGLLFIVAFALTACPSKSPSDEAKSSTPDAVVKEFVETVAENRIDEAIEYFSWKNIKEDEIGAKKEMLRTILGAGMYEEIKDSGGIGSMTATLDEQEGDAARVLLEIEFKNGEAKAQKINLINDSGKWKFVLDM